MSTLKHPVVLLAVGVVIGLVFASQLKSLPLVNKLPSA